jgi:hypothetical protein
LGDLKGASYGLTRAHTNKKAIPKSSPTTTHAAILTIPTARELTAAFAPETDPFDHCHECRPLSHHVNLGQKPDASRYRFIGSAFRTDNWKTPPKNNK